MSRLSHFIDDICYNSPNRLEGISFGKLWRINDIRDNEVQKRWRKALFMHPDITIYVPLLDSYGFTFPENVIVEVGLDKQKFIPMGMLAKEMHNRSIPGAAVSVVAPTSRRKRTKRSSLTDMDMDVVDPGESCDADFEHPEEEKEDESEEEMEEASVERRIPPTRIICSNDEMRLVVSEKRYNIVFGLHLDGVGKAEIQKAFIAAAGRARGGITPTALYTEVKEALGKRDIQTQQMVWNRRHIEETGLLVTVTSKISGVKGRIIDGVLIYLPRFVPRVGSGSRELAVAAPTAPTPIDIDTQQNPPLSIAGPTTTTTTPTPTSTALTRTGYSVPEHFPHPPSRKLPVELPKKALFQSLYQFLRENTSDPSSSIPNSVLAIPFCSGKSTSRIMDLTFRKLTVAFGVELHNIESATAGAKTFETALYVPSKSPPTSVIVSSQAASSASRPQSGKNSALIVTPLQQHDTIHQDKKDTDVYESFMCKGVPVPKAQSSITRHENHARVVLALINRFHVIPLSAIADVFKGSIAVPHTVLDDKKMITDVEEIDVKRRVPIAPVKSVELKTTGKVVLTLISDFETPPFKLAYRDDTSDEFLPCEESYKKAIQNWEKSRFFDLISRTVILSPEEADLYESGRPSAVTQLTFSRMKLQKVGTRWGSSVAYSDAHFEDGTLMDELREKNTLLDIIEWKPEDLFKISESWFRSAFAPFFRSNGPHGCNRSPFSNIPFISRCYVIHCASIVATIVKREKEGLATAKASEPLILWLSWKDDVYPYIDESFTMTDREDNISMSEWGTYRAELTFLKELGLVCCLPDFASWEDITIAIPPVQTAGFPSILPGVPLFHHLSITINDVKLHQIGRNRVASFWSELMHSILLLHFSKSREPLKRNDLLDRDVFNNMFSDCVVDYLVDSEKMFKVAPKMKTKLSPRSSSSTSSSSGRKQQSDSYLEELRPTIHSPICVSWIWLDAYLNSVLKLDQIRSSMYFRSLYDFERVLHTMLSKYILPVGCEKDGTLASRKKLYSLLRKKLKFQALERQIVPPRSDEEDDDDDDEDEEDAMEVEQRARAPSKPQLVLDRYTLASSFTPWISDVISRHIERLDEDGEGVDKRMDIDEMRGDFESEFEGEVLEGIRVVRQLRSLVGTIIGVNSQSLTRKKSSSSSLTLRRYLDDVLTYFSSESIPPNLAFEGLDFSDVVDTSKPANSKEVMNVLNETARNLIELLDQQDDCDLGVISFHDLLKALVSDGLLLPIRTIELSELPLYLAVKNENAGQGVRYLVVGLLERLIDSTSMPEMFLPSDARGERTCFFPWEFVPVPVSAWVTSAVFDAFEIIIERKVGLSRDEAMSEMRKSLPWMYNSCYQSVFSESISLKKIESIDEVSEFDDADGWWLSFGDMKV